MTIIDHMQKLLLEHSTEIYHINYNKFFINHLAQGLIALGRLGASNERQDRYINWYGVQMTPGRARGYVDPPEITSQTVSQLLGKYQGYYKIYDHYENKFNNEHGKSLEKFIVKEFPALAPGIGGGAFHGLIHLGYGYSVKNSRIVIESMAYIHFLYNRPILKDDVLNGPIGEGTEEALKILLELQKRKDIYEIGRANPILPNKGYFISFQEGILANEKACQDLLEYIKRIKLPKPDSKNSLGDILVNMCLTVFVTSARKNDFFLLHGGTSSWALKEILPLFKDNPSFVSFLYHTYMINLLTTYLAVTGPDLITSQLTDAPTKENSWDQIIERTFAEDYDEHIFKIVQVAHDMFNEHPENEHLYKAVALSALDQKFAHVSAPYPGQRSNIPDANK